MNPEFSIVTPSFESIAWLPLCVASVADQRGVRYEHLVQDAGSTDGTPEWILRDGRANIVVEPDRGMYDAINKGIGRATGELIAYLNCDEQYLPGALSQVAKFFAENPQVDVLFGDAVLVDAKFQPLSYRRAVLPWRPHVRWVHLNTLTCSTFFRRRVIEQGHLFDPRWRAIGDGVWVDQLLRARTPMAVLPEPLAVFAFTGDNLGSSERASREQREWRGGDWQRHFSSIFSFIHRLQKWRAGAYQRRKFSTEIYTRDSPERRQEISCPSIGYHWPTFVRSTPEGQ